MDTYEKHSASAKMLVSSFRSICVYVAVLVFLSQVIRFVVLALPVSHFEFVTDGLLLGVCVSARARVCVCEKMTPNQRGVYT